MNLSKSSIRIGDVHMLPLNNSFVNCSQLKTVAKEKFNHSTYVDHIDDEELIDSIRKTVVESPYSNRQLLKEFRIIDN